MSEKENGTQISQIFADKSSQLSVYQRRQLPHLRSIQRETSFSDSLLEDAYLLDDVRMALRREDLETATQLARVFKLTPIAA